MRTAQSGSFTNGFSSNKSIDYLIEYYSKYYGLTKSSFIRLGINLAAKRLENKEQIKVNKIVGVR